MADIKLFDTDKKEKKPNFVERALLKNAINEVKPKTEKLKGAEKIYHPEVVNWGQHIGDAAAWTALYGVGNSITDNSTNKINNYLAEAKKPETVNALNKIVSENKEIMSQLPSTKGQEKLIANTIQEVQYPRDFIEDIEMDLKNNPHLSENQKNKIINGSLERFEKDQNALNNLEATRPDRGTLGHSKDTAEVFGILMNEAFPELSKSELNKKIKDAELHDYGKGMVRYRDLNSKNNPHNDEDLWFGTHKPEIDTHTERGAEALKNIGEKDAAKYAEEHHSTPETLEDSLMKAADIYNAITGDRVYKEAASPERALAIMKGNVAKGEITQEAYDILKKAVNSGKIKAPKNYQSELYDVYATEAGNAIEEKGIKLFDVGNYSNTNVGKFVKNVQSFNDLMSAISSGQGFEHVSKKVIDKATKRQKVEALMQIYKDKDWLVWKNLQKGVYNDKTIDKLFKENIDEIAAQLHTQSK